MIRSALKKLSWSPMIPRAGPNRWVPPSPVLKAFADSNSKQAPVQVRSLSAAQITELPSTPFKDAKEREIGVTFEDAHLAFQSKSTFELVRALMVFKLCGVTPLVQNSKKLMNLGFNILGEPIMKGVLKTTFFGHFCAGENGEDIQPTLHKLQRSGVGYILDYAAEADVPEEDVEVSLDREGVVSARIYDYENEKKCDANAQVILECIDAASRNKNGFAAVKLTALGNVELLEHISVVLHSIRRLFRMVSTRPDELERNWDFYMTRVVDLPGFKEGLHKMGIQLSDEEIENFFHKVDMDKNEHIDFLEWTQSLHPGNLEFKAFFELGSDPDTKSPITLPSLDPDQINQMNSMISRIEKICRAAHENNVRLMIDAEQTYFQPAIDHMTTIMMQKYNTGDFPVIYNTYQCYLNDSYSRVMLDMERARRLNYKFAAKIVRGAYMFQERKRAIEFGYKDPIQPNLQATHDNYHYVMNSILEEVKENGANVMVASHNEKSVMTCLKKMDDLNISKEDGVFFGQLLGMCDHVSFTLGLMDYNVYKYVPYGPVKEVMPYLIRRADENSDMLGGVGKEMKLLRDEIWRRVIPGAAPTR